ncbi:hypothetical protein Drorol1_Dr00019739 [Drosera rotundifolia]
MTALASSPISSGALVVLEELNPLSPHYTNGASLRVTGKLTEYAVETAEAVIADGSATLRIDAKHLKLNFRLGSLYQFIGELDIQLDNQVILKARVGRNVDGMDLDLYRQSLQLLREFQSKQTLKLSI